MPDNSTNPRREGGVEPFRFSLRGLLVFVLICSVACAVLFRVFLPAIREANETVRRRTCVNNLKQIGFALRNYHEVYGCFPSPYIPDAKGKPMHSWRAVIVPYLEAGSFWPMYDLTQPWDSPANLGLARSFPFSCYVCASAKQPSRSGFTNYVMIVGAAAAMRGGEWTSLDDIADAPHTVIIAEIADSDIFWSEPRDLSFDEMSFQINDKSKPSISSHHSHGAMVLFADGSVKFLDESTKPEELKAMLTASSALKE
jgi:prepilin-type processing-associated H-X9-DG protein